MSENGRVPLQQYVEARIADVVRLMDERFAGSDRHWDRALDDLDEKSKQRIQSVTETARVALMAANDKRRDAIALVAVIISMAAMGLTLVLHFLK